MTGVPQEVAPDAQNEKARIAAGSAARACRRGYQAGRTSRVRRRVSRARCGRGELPPSDDTPAQALSSIAEVGPFSLTDEIPASRACADAYIWLVPMT